MPVFLKLDEKRDLLTVSIGKMDKSAFSDTLARVKSIPGARWEPTNKLWLFQNDPDKALRLITALQPVASPEVESIVRQRSRVNWSRTSGTTPRSGTSLARTSYFRTSAPP